MKAIQAASVVRIDLKTLLEGLFSLVVLLQEEKDLTLLPIGLDVLGVQFDSLKQNIIIFQFYKKKKEGKYLFDVIQSLSHIHQLGEGRGLVQIEHGVVVVVLDGLIVFTNTLNVFALLEELITLLLVLQSLTLGSATNKIPPRDCREPS